MIIHKSRPIVAAIYTRTSESKKPNRIDFLKDEPLHYHQLHDCERFISSWSYCSRTTPEYFTDNGVSGAISPLNRKAFIRAVEALERYPDSARRIIVSDASRFSREARTGIPALDELESRGITVYGVQECRPITDRDIKKAEREWRKSPHKPYGTRRREKAVLALINNLVGHGVHYQLVREIIELNGDKPPAKSTISRIRKRHS